MTEGTRPRYSSLATIVLALIAAASCKDAPPRVAKTDPTVTPRDSVADWARGLDSLADSAHAREFKFPARSSEGGIGRFYQLGDSSVRIDVDDLRETGRSLERFYVRGKTLRLAVAIDERYDQPMSGNVVKTDVDTTWFVADTATKWRDSVGVVRAGRDSLLEAHGRAVLAEYLWSTRMAGPEGKPKR